MRRAVFLDKDGTLLEDVPYNVDPQLMRFMPGAPSALRILEERGYLLFVVSNQSGVARGYVSEEEVVSAGRRLEAMFGREGVTLAGFYYCPHLEGGSVAVYALRCGCRKPEPGLIVRAGREHGIDLGRSWMVGDILDDVEAGRRAGCRTVLVDRGGETEWHGGEQRVPDHVVSDLEQAALTIVSGDVPASRNARTTARGRA